MIRELNSASEIQRLKSFLAGKMPQSMAIFMIIRMQEDYEKKWIFYVDEKDPTLFIFVPSICPFQSFSIYWDRERLSDDEVKHRLRAIPGWNWSQPFVAFCINTAFEPLINQSLLKGELCEQKHYEKQRGPCVIIQLTSDKIQEKPVPKGYKLGTLEPKHAQLVLDTWEYELGETVSTIAECLRTLPSSAVFKDDDANNDNPVSWILLKLCGQIGMTYTLPEYRRKD